MCRGRSRPSDPGSASEDRHARPPPVQLDHPDRVVERGARPVAPPRGRPAYPGKPRKPAHDHGGCPGLGHGHHAPLRGAERISEGGADDLVHAAAACLEPSQRYLGDVRVVDITADHRDRSRRVVPVAAIGGVPEQLHHPLERPLEGGPVLEVERATQLLAQTCGEPAPRPGAHSLAPRLQVVHPGREEHRHRADDHEVIERAAAVLDDPLPLLVVHHVAASIGEHPCGAGVDDQHARPPEVAEVRPPRGGRFTVGMLGEPLQRLPDVTAGGGGAVQRLRGQLRRCQIPEVLVDPVGHERAGDPVVPPPL